MVVLMREEPVVQSDTGTGAGAARRARIPRTQPPAILLPADGRPLLRRLVHVMQALTGELEPERLHAAVLRTVQEVTGAGRVTLQVLDPTGDFLVLAAGVGLPEGVELGQRAPRSAGLAGWVAERRRPLLVMGACHRNPEVRRRLRAVTEQCAMCVPLVAKGQVLGVLNASTFGASRQFTHDDLEFLEVLAGPAAIAIAHARLFEQTSRLATTDTLTGLLNHRAFKEQLAAERERAARTGDGFGLLALDLDGFKQVNDRAGHAAGDRLLRLVADQAIRGSIRPYDVGGRLGGDEFAVLLPHTDPAHVAIVGERIRHAIHALDVAAHGIPVGVTCSIGTAHFPSDATTSEALQRAADSALYYLRFARIWSVVGAGVGFMNGAAYHNERTG